MLVAGAFGTYLGGRVSDARGRGPLIAGSLAALVPLVAAVPLAPPALAFAVVVAAGFAVEMSYYPLLAVAQDALPRRAGFAAGVVLGLSIGIGAACVGLLGRLADAYGPRAALWACAGFAALALAVAAALRSE